MTTDTQANAYRQLAAAVLLQAVKDAQSGNGHAAPARWWLTRDTWAGDLLDGLGLDREAVGDWIAGLDPVQQSVLPL